MTRALVAGGFHRRNQQPIFLRFPAEDEIISGRLRVQMLDNDAAFSHHGFAELWARSIAHCDFKVPGFPQRLVVRRAAGIDT